MRPLNTEECRIIYLNFSKYRRLIKFVQVGFKVEFVQPAIDIRAEAARTLS
jgi:hypothetical protein